MLFQKLEGFADAGQHTECQNIDLQKPKRGDVVLVPFDESAVGHRRVADGHDFDQRPARQDKPADVLREMTRKAHQLLREIQHGSKQRIVGIEACFAYVLFWQSAAGTRAPHHTGQRRNRIFRQPHRLAGIAHSRAGTIADDGCGEAGAITAVAGVDVLNDFLAPLMLEIDVDVGRFAARF